MATRACSDKCNSHGDCLSFLVQSFDRGALTLMRVLLEGQTTESAVQTLERACGLLGDSCWNLILSRRGTDDPLKVKTEMALIREAYDLRHLRESDVAISAQKLVRPFHPSRNHVLMWGPSSRRLELSGKMVGTEMGNGSHLVQQARSAKTFPFLPVPLRFASRSSPPPIPQPRSLKNASSISMPGPPRSGSATAMAAWHSFPAPRSAQAIAERHAGGICDCCKERMQREGPAL
jgi:hypothetical protein